ncbi:putative YT521-B-like domain-containing protein [Seiridium cardinale]|uniref:YT521-B-like domain-containing protein n=1 Tax=Seiridium cardinale TaxID=138064 RepID=A0ABR2Y1Y5_9PEZI
MATSPSASFEAYDQDYSGGPSGHTAFEPATSGEAGKPEAQVVASNQDMEDWLEFTNWHDVRYRDEKLAYHRTLRHIQQQRAALEAEEEKLRQFEQKYPRAQHTDSLHTAQPAIEAAPLTNTYATQTAGAPFSFGDNHYGSRDGFHESTGQYNGGEEYANSIGPDYADNGDYEAQAQTPMPEQYLTPGTKSGHRDGGSRDRNRSSVTPTRKSEWPRVKRSVKQNNLFLERREYRDDRGVPFKPIDLGKSGDTRFFVIKSYTLENVEDSMEDGIWASKHDNAKKLVEAFNTCKNVILIFSANQSRKFQGYARMTGTPSGDLPKPKWWTAIKWPISEPYTIEWISKTPMDDDRSRALKNSLNDDLPVTRSRDCQELDEYCGRTMISMLNSEASTA